MPGIYGTLRAEYSAEIPLGALLDQMAARMRHHSWYLEARHVDEAAGLALGRTSLGIIEREVRPVINEEGSITVTMEGEIHDARALRRELAADGHAPRGESDAELLLRGYEFRGRDFFRRLNGVFTVAIWDGRTRTFALANDRFGMKPLYYAAAPGKIVFGSEIKAVLADPDISRAASARGAAQFLYFGQYLGDDTSFDSVRVLPAAAWLTYQPDLDRLHLDRYWRLETDGMAASTTLSEAEHIDRVDDAFQRAVGRCTEGGHALGLSLSGGLDSRLILGVANPGAKITTVSIGVKGSLDHVGARRMAGMAGALHHEYHLGGGFLEDYEAHLKHMVRLTDGQYLSQCIVIPSLPLYRELGVRVLLRGHAGELMHMNKAYNFSIDQVAVKLNGEVALEDWLFRRMTNFMAGSVPDDLFPAASAESARELARDSLRECLAESDVVNPLLHRVWHLFLSQRLRRETALSMAEFGSQVETRLPYLDNDLVDALMAAPPGLKLSDRIQHEILRRRRPDFLKVVNSNTGARMGAGTLERKIATFRLKVLSKLRVSGFQPYERLGEWLREDLRSLVQRLLLSGPFLDRGVFNPDVIRGVVNQHLDGGKNHTYLILGLMIFEAGQRDLADVSLAASSAGAADGR